MKLASIAFSLSLLAAAVNAAAPSSWKTLNVYKKDVERTMEHFKKNRDHRTAHYRSKKVASHTSTLNLHDSQDFYYFCELQIGTPPQNVFVDIDTGSSDLWFTTNLPHHPCDNCTGPTAFDSKKSSTFTPWRSPFEIQYLDGSEAVGIVAVDSVSVGGIPIQDQNFGAISLTNATGSDYNGLMGLSFISISSTIPVFYNIWNQKLVNQPYFSLYLPHFNGGKNSGGALTIGGVDNRFFIGKMKYYSVVSPYFYDVAMNSVSANGRVIKLPSKSSATIDSGTSLAYGPTKIWRQLFDKQPGLTLCGNNEDCAGFYKFSCTHPPKLQVSLYFGKDKYDFNPVDLNGGPIAPNSTECLLTIGDAGNDSNEWLIGDVFMRNYYISFSPIKKQVGFAKLKSGGVYF